MYQFTEDCLIGIPKIDEEHRKLFGLINEATDLLSVTPLAPANVQKILSELNSYVATHFAHEEEFMESINFRHIWSEKHQHITFVNRLESIDLKAMDENQQDHLMEIIEFLALWLQGHIKGADKRIGTYYDSLPDEAKA